MDEKPARRTDEGTDGKADGKLGGFKGFKGAKEFKVLKPDFSLLAESEKFMKTVRIMFILLGALLALTGMLVFVGTAGGAAGVFMASLGFVYLIIAALKDPPDSKYTRVIERKMSVHKEAFDDYEQEFYEYEGDLGVDEISLLMIREYLDICLKRGWLQFKWGVILSVIGTFLFTVAVGGIAVSGADIAESAVFVLPGMLTLLAAAILFVIYAQQQKQLSAHYVQMIESERRKSAVRLADKLSGEDRSTAYLSFIHAEIKRNSP